MTETEGPAVAEEPLAEALTPDAEAEAPRPVEGAEAVVETESAEVPVQTAEEEMPAAEEPVAEPARTAGEIRFERNARLMKVLSAAGYDHAMTGAVSSLIAKIDREEQAVNLKLAVYHGLVHAYGRAEGKKLYDTVKGSIDEPKEGQAE